MSGGWIVDFETGPTCEIKVPSHGPTCPKTDAVTGSAAAEAYKAPALCVVLRATAITRTR